MPPIKYLGFTAEGTEFEIRPEQNIKTLLVELKLYRKNPDNSYTLMNEQEAMCCLMAFVVGTAESNIKAPKGRKH